VKLSAGRLRVAIGERILPLAGVTAPPSDKLRILRLTDGVAEVAYGFGEVIDIVTLGEVVQPATSLGEVSGVALIGGEQVEVIDTYWLFGAHSSAQPDVAAKPVCALPDDDPWMRNILRPIMESAGYTVVSAAEADAEVDVVIAGSDTVPAPAAGMVLRLRTEIEPANENDDSIYRYDRAALLSALSRGPATGAKRKKGRA
jgi:two-component system chemotaxis sensor kinase CheA